MFKPFDPSFNQNDRRKFWKIMFKLECAAIKRYQITKHFDRLES